MKTKRFVAKDTPEALKLISEELGVDAVILSNKTTLEGVELIASADYPLHEMQLAATNTPGHTHNKWFNPKIFQGLDEADNKQLTGLKQEVQLLRSVIEDQMSELIWEKKRKFNPVFTTIINRLINKGFSKNVAQIAVDTLPLTLPLEAAWLKVPHILEFSFNVEESLSMPDHSIHAFMGGSGSGKTLTLIKMAALFLTKNSSEDILIITLNNMRIGSAEEIKKYGKIFNISVQEAESREHLLRILNESRHKKLVLIDTPGLTVKDRVEESSTYWLNGIEGRIKKHLIVPSFLQYAYLEKYLPFFIALNVRDCILTRLDEVKSLGEVLSALLESQLPIYGISESNEIPNGLRPCKIGLLIREALSGKWTQNRELDDTTVAHILREAKIDELPIYHQ